jgi:hypothetical protein
MYINLLTVFFSLNLLKSRVKAKDKQLQKCMFLSFTRDSAIMNQTYYFLTSFVYHVLGHLVDVIAILLELFPFFCHVVYQVWV